jgi:transcriptional regulator
VSDPRAVLLQGTLDLLILKALAASGSLHGYGVARWIQEATGDALVVEEGSLYPALHRLERRGLLRARWGASEANRRAKYYLLTRAGRDHLERETASWQRFSAAMARALATV